MKKARIYLLSIIDNKKNKAMSKTFEILEDKNATRYTLFEDKENPANLEEFHYPSFKEDLIEELGKILGEETTDHRICDRKYYRKIDEIFKKAGGVRQFNGQVITTDL